MSNIHSIQAQGSGIQLGPVTVLKTYELKPGDKQRYVKVSDASGESGLKIWGAAMNTPLQEGQVITLVGSGPRGGIKNQEYPTGSGKWTLNANDCRLEIQGQGAPGYAPPPQPQYQPAPQQAYQQPAPQSQTLAQFQAQPPQAYQSAPPASMIPPSGKDMQIIRQNALAHATALLTACGAKNVFQDQTTIIRLAERYAHFSATGEIGEEVDYIPM